MKPKIIDAFYYNGEVDLLKIRLNILDKYVDQFVVLEANKTFSGIPKTSFFERDRESWKQWEYKINFYYVQDWDDEKLWKIAKDSPNTNGADHWKQEFYNKEKMKVALSGFEDEDVIFVSDCDEIWDPLVLMDLPVWTIGTDRIYRINQKVYSYFLNQRSNEEWAGTLMLKYKDLKNAILNHVRVANHPRIGNGWHFTNQGGIEEVKRKLNDSYTEQSYNTARSRQMLEDKYGHQDWFGRDFKYWLDESEWPEYLKNNKEKYERFLKKV